MPLRDLGSADDVARRRNRMLREAEGKMTDAAGAALRQFLRQVRGEVTTTDALVAATGDVPTSLRLFTLGQASGWWTQALDAHVTSEVRRIWRTGYHDTRDGDLLLSDQQALDDYLANVTDRLSRTATPTIPERAFNVARSALSDELARAASIDDMALRLAQEFSWDADATWSRKRLAQIDRQIDSILDPIGPPGHPDRERIRLTDPDVARLQAERRPHVAQIDRVKSDWEVRAERIARTESCGAFSAGALDAALAEGAAVKRWMATGDDRTREEHLAASGQCVPIRDAFVVGGEDLMMPGDPHASAGMIINCRAVLPGTRVRGDVLVAMKRPWSGPTRIIETASGHRLATTPEHPILTGCGWLAAGDVEVGDECMGDPLDVEGAGGRPLRGVDEQHPMSTVEEVHETLALASLRGQGRRGYARDLDDDGSHVQVDVVAADHPLAFGLDAEEAQRLGDLGVALSHHEMCATDDPATLVRVTHPHVPGFRPAAWPVPDFREPGRKDRPGYPEVGRDPADGLSRLMPSDDLVNVDRMPTAEPGAARSLRTAADHPRLVQPIVRPGEATSGRIRDLLERRSFRVHLDEVVAVRDGWWDGHVYDLTTVGGTLVTDGILTHNCTIVFADSCEEMSSRFGRVDEVIDAQRRERGLPVDDSAGVDRPASPRVVGVDADR